MSYAKNNTDQTQLVTRATINQSLIGNEITLYQFFQNTKPLESIIVSIPLHQALDNPLSFILYIDIDANAKFQNKEIAVNEVPAPVEDDLPNAFPIDFKSDQQLKTLLSFSEGTKLKAKLIVTDFSTNPEQVVVKEVMAKKVHVDIGEIFDPASGFTGGVGTSDGSHGFMAVVKPFISNPFVIYAQGGKKGGDNVPVSHDKVPDLGGRKGKQNECVPLSFANSLLWLAKEHNFENQLPATEDKLVDELATDVKWTKNGTKNEDIFPGKEAFTNSHKLPLVNKKIDNNFTEGESDLWKKIVSELNDGEDVELILDFKETPQGKPTKGHAVTVVGADKTKKGKQTITIHDPATPAGNDTYEVARNGQIVNYPLGKVFGNFIISESHATPSATPSSSPTPIPSNSPAPTIR